MDYWHIPNLIYTSKNCIRICHLDQLIKMVKKLLSKKFTKFTRIIIQIRLVNRADCICIPWIKVLRISRVYFYRSSWHFRLFEQAFVFLAGRRQPQEARVTAPQEPVCPLSNEFAVDSQTTQAETLHRQFRVRLRRVTYGNERGRTWKTPTSNKKPFHIRV